MHLDPADVRARRRRIGPIEVASGDVRARRDDLKDISELVGRFRCDFPHHEQSIARVVAARGRHEPERTARSRREHVRLLVRAW
jgi:hypothetical protein